MTSGYVYHTDQAELEEMVSMLSQGLAVIKHEQEYMEVRERIHRMSEWKIFRKWFLGDSIEDILHTNSTVNINTLYFSR